MHVESGRSKQRAGAAVDPAPSTPTRPPPSECHRGASSAACGSRPSSRKFDSNCNWAWGCMSAPANPNAARGTGRRQQQSRHDGVIRASTRPRSVRVAVDGREAVPAVVQTRPQLRHRDAGAESLEQAGAECHHHPVGIADHHHHGAPGGHFSRSGRSRIAPRGRKQSVDIDRVAAGIAYHCIRGLEGLVDRVDPCWRPRQRDVRRRALPATR